MRLLLDTHIWLWSLLEPKRLSSRVARELESSANELWVSPISVWETLILVERGRVVLEAEPAKWIDDVFRAIPFKEAPLGREVAVQSRLLDLPHQDPVDRFLAATARVYGLTLVTADRRLLRGKGFALLANR